MLFERKKRERKGKKDIEEKVAGKKLRKKEELEKKRHEKNVKNATRKARGRKLKRNEKYEKKKNEEIRKGKFRSKIFIFISYNDQTSI